MAIVINRTEEITSELKREDKVSLMDTPEEMAAILEVDRIMEAVSKDYQVKDSKSQITASSVVLTD